MLALSTTFQYLMLRDKKRVIEDRQVAARLQVAQVTVGVYKSLGGDWKINTEIGD